mmetsp:Transcript_62247/g.148547  ORF Transcript_62247/g.148547 Transcript_62247/m.148547 type:complete len:207 (+) Transcript_62247:112-732(+)
MAEPIGKPSDGGQDEALEAAANQGLSIADQLDWHGQRHVRVGRVHLFKVGTDRVIYIGPHWYCSIIMLFIVVSVGCTYIFVFAVDMGLLHRAFGGLATSLSVITFLQCALADPGILAPNPNRDLKAEANDVVQLMPSAGGRVCAACDIVQPIGSFHCEFCKVCVMGHDHHCPWMSKCIGSNNLGEFYTFLCTSIGSLVYIVVASVI